MSFLKNILLLSGKSNMGGIIGSLYISRKADIESIPVPVNGVIYGDIVFKPGKSWVNWRVTLASGSATNDTRQTNEGSTKSNRLPFSIPRFDAALHDMFNACSEDEFIVLYKETNGKQKIFGLLQTPVRFSFTHNTGKEFANKNEFSCQFFYNGPENMFEYNGAIASPPAGPAPAVVRFNGVAIASLQSGDTLNIESDYSFTDYFII
jgi:hypothetical protein